MSRALKSVGTGMFASSIFCTVVGINDTGTLISGAIGIVLIVLGIGVTK